MAQERKSDTRRKIELGGLVVKAGLAGESKGVVLGILLAAGKRLALDGEREYFERIGNERFAKDRCGSAP